jgi:hypothetical protein
VVLSKPQLGKCSINIPDGFVPCSWQRSPRLGAAFRCSWTDEMGSKGMRRCYTLGWARPTGFECTIIMFGDFRPRPGSVARNRLHSRLELLLCVSRSSKLFSSSSRVETRVENTRLVFKVFDSRVWRCVDGFQGLQDQAESF